MFAVTPDRALPALARFRCIADACEDTCCAHTHIGVGRREYERLARLLGSRDELDRHVAVNDFPLRFAEYATLRMGPEGGCGFLRPDQLCSLQHRFGEAALPATCATFPRVITRDEVGLLLTGSVACPEVARQVLLHDDAMSLEPAPADPVTRCLFDETRPIEGRLRELWGAGAAPVDPAPLAADWSARIAQRRELGGSPRFGRLVAKVLDALGAEPLSAYLSAKAALGADAKALRQRALSRTAALASVRGRGSSPERERRRQLLRASLLDLVLCPLVAAAADPRVAVVDAVQLCARYFEEHPLFQDTLGGAAAPQALSLLEARADFSPGPR